MIVRPLSSIPSTFPSSFIGPIFAAVVLSVGLVGCDSVGPSASSGSAPVSISFASESGPSSKASAKQATYTDSEGNTLQITAVELVVQEMKFDRADGSEDCSDEEDDRADDDCEEVESGPVLVSLPLDSGRPSVVIDTTLPVGTWEEVKFEVEEAGEDGLREEDFPADVSIRAQGSFTPADGATQSFTYTSDLSAEREIEFEPPIEVTSGEPTNVTFSVAVNSWFRQRDSTLVNPTRADDDGRFEDLVEENIETSIEGFEDDDRDGEEEDEEEGENDDEDEDDDDSDDENETEIEVDLNNTGPDTDASGEAEFEKRADRTEFKVEVEDLDPGTYDVVVADTTRGQIEVTERDDGTEGDIEFRNPSEEEHPLLEFDPRGAHVAVVQEGTIYLEVDFPAREGSGDDDGGDDEGDEDDDDDDEDEDDETEVEVDFNNTGPDTDASGEAEFEEESDRIEFKVEVEDLDPGTYDLVVADTSRAEIEVTGSDDDGEGEIEFRRPPEDGHPLLDFDPLGSHVAVVQNGTVYLDVDFPSGGDDD